MEAALAVGGEERVLDPGGDRKAARAAPSTGSSALVRSITVIGTRSFAAIALKYSLRGWMLHV